jgi:hypothetical protein
MPSFLTRQRLWRSVLYKELDEWCSKHQQSSKRRKSNSRAVAIANVVVDRRFKDMDDFADPLDAGATDTAAALVAAAEAAGAPAGGAPGCT